MSFDERLAKVRQRFSGTLESKIVDLQKAVPDLSGGAGAAANVAECYRRVHAICGIAPTAGFPAAGRAARAAEVVLLEAQLSNRGLNASEAAGLKKALDALLTAARAELQAMYSRAL
jgi:chemotaxis protein histidine kinase CheA